MNSTEYETLFQNIQKFKNCRVLVVGDVGLDEYLKGHVSRVSPEAPVPVLEAEEQSFALGLASNVAQNIKSLGGDVRLIGIIGEDEAAKKLKILLKRKGIRTGSLISDTKKMTTRKIRMLARNQHILRLDYEDSEPLPKKLQTELILKTRELISECDGLVIQDYAKGTLNEYVIRELIEVAHLHQKKVIIDPHRKTPLKNYWGADIFKPNQEEALILSNLKEKETISIKKNKVKKEEFYRNVALKLLDQLASEFIVLTRGNEGISLYSKEKVFHFPTEAQSVYDVTGAGDTVLAVLSLGIFSKMHLPETCVLSNLAASEVVQKIGAISCTKEGLEKALQKAFKKAKDLKQNTKKIIENKYKKRKIKKDQTPSFSKNDSPLLENPLNFSLKKTTFQRK